MAGLTRISLLSGLMAIAIACGSKGGGAAGAVDTPEAPPVTYSVGGTVTGLGGGEQVVLTNGSDTLTVTANGAFTFANKVLSSTAYNVLVSSHTVVGGGCTAGSNVGTVSGANVTNVSVICGATRILSVQVTDLSAAGALGGGLVFQNNGGDNRTVAAFATPMAFSIAVVQGASYNITVLNQPSSPNQVCSPITTGSGTMPTSALTVTFGCSTSFFTVSATVSGLAGTGLRLRNNNNGADELTPITNGTSAFSVAVAAGMPYAVTVFAPPANLSQTCTVTGGGNGNGGGNISAPVTVNVGCVTNPYAVSGTVSGLTAAQFVTLQINGANNQTVTAPATAFSFPALADGTPYAVSVLSKTAGIGCSISANGSGTLAGATVNTVAVTCGTCLPGGTEQVTVTWTASRSYDVFTALGGGHKIYYDWQTGVSKSTPNVVDVPRTTSTTSGVITGLRKGCTYFVKVGGYSALNAAGGNLSSESSILVP